jgi:hypothetical protein
MNVTQDQPNWDRHSAQGFSGLRQDQQSRRKFLRAAVVSGAAVAAVGAAGAAAASASPQLLRQLRGEPATPSAHSMTEMCFENTEYQPIPSFDVKAGHASPPQFFIWFTTHNLPAGTYTFTLAPPITYSSTPFELAPNGNGNAVFTFEVANGLAVKCPHAEPNAPTKSKHDFSGAFPYLLGSTTDFQVKAHIDWKAGSTIASDTLYTFIGTLTDGVNTYTSSVSVTAIKK